MSVDVVAVCAESAQREVTANAATVFGVIFCIYIFFDVLLAFVTIGAKAQHPKKERDRHNEIMGRQGI